MKNCLLSPAERLYVETARSQTDDKTAYMKLSVLVCLDEGLTQEQTATVLGISSSTVYNCKRKFGEDGLSKYLDRHYVPYSGRLDDEQLAALDTEVDEGLYRSIAEIGEWIDRKFEVQYSQSGLRQLLKKLGFVYKKAGQLPGNVDVKKQDEFMVELKQFLEMEMQDHEAIYFMDAVHPQHNTRPDYVWTKRGKEKWIPSNTGRRRVNINAAINFADPTEVQIVEADSINGQTTQELLEKILLHNPDKSSIYVIADNARYYHFGGLEDWLLDNPQIQILHLPAYSPNLNLIERLWKFMRKKVINLHYYPKFDDFKAAILNFFKNLGQYKQELASLITPNFQRFSIDFST
jgi:transposase